MEGPHFTCCDAMRCKCVIAARSCIRGVPSGVKPVFAQGACLSLSLSLWAFSCLTFQAQGSLRTYLALHMQPFIRLLSLRPLKEEGVHIRGYLDAH